jgi:hypothetical protein
MPLLSANQTLIDDFLRVIEPFETAHVHPTFSYIAIKQHVSTGASSDCNYAIVKRCEGRYGSCRTVGRGGDHP